MSRRRREPTPDQPPEPTPDQPPEPTPDQPPEPTPDDPPTVDVLPATVNPLVPLPPAAIARLLSRRDAGIPEPRVSARLPHRAGIVLHCTASVRPTSPEHALERVRKIHRVHTAPRRMVDGVNRGGRGWPAAGYHWAVDPWGNVYQLLGWGLVGRHAKTAPPSLNMSTHGIVLLGKGLETTEAERAAVRWLVEDAERRFGPQWVIGHGQVSSKECPGPAGRALVQALARPR